MTSAEIVNLTDFRQAPVTNVTSPFAAFDESPIFFPVVGRDLAWKDKNGDTNDHFHNVPTHKMLLRTHPTTHAPIQLAVVGDGYSIVQNRELFNEVERQFVNAFSRQELDGVTVRDKLAYEGAYCLREYAFPNVQCKMPGIDKVIAFRTVIMHGFGKSAIKGFIGAIDFYCENGMVIGMFDRVYRRHTKGLKLGEIGEKVHRGIDVFYKQADIWLQWYNKALTDHAAHDFLVSISSKRLGRTLFNQYLVEKRVRGANMWALYSAMTYYASHSEGDFAIRTTSNDHAAQTLASREETVSRWVRSEAWHELEAA